MRIHTGKTSHYCNICPKQFKDSKGLKQHLLMHERKSQINSNPSIEQTVETSAKPDPSAGFTNNEVTSTQSTNIQMPASAIQWAIDQNAAAFQMPTDEPTFENGATQNVNSGLLNPIVRVQTFDDISKFFFKAD